MARYQHGLEISTTTPDGAAAFDAAIFAFL